MENSVKVFLWNEEIGILVWNKAKNLSYFTFNPEWKGLDVQPFPRVEVDKPLLPIWGEGTRDSMRPNINPYQKLPSFIADSLPDKWGSMLFDAWINERHINPDEITPLEKLSFIGKRGTGALEYVPDIDIIDRQTTIDIKDLAQRAADIYLDRTQKILTEKDKITQEALISLGSSLGGRFPKAVIAINRETRDIKSGQIDGLKGYDYNILKFNFGKTYPSAALEMTYYNMAIDAGIKMMPSELFHVENEKHFMTRRFDRINGEKVHTQTVAAIDPEARSYESLISICRKLMLPEKDCEEVFRRMVFNLIANNTDDHNRNFTFTLPKNGAWQLSPAYDMNYIADRYDYTPATTHEFSIQGETHFITLKDAIMFAKDNDIKQPGSIIHQVADVLKDFDRYAEKWEFSPDFIGNVKYVIDKHLKEWGLSVKDTIPVSRLIDGKTVGNFKRETNEKGDVFILSAEIDKQPMKLYFRKNSPYYPLLSGNNTDLFRSGKLDDVFRTEFFRRLKPVPSKETLPETPKPLEDYVLPANIKDNIDKIQIFQMNGTTENKKTYVVQAVLKNGTTTPYRKINRQEFLAVTGSKAKDIPPTATRDNLAAKYLIPDIKAKITKSWK